jgi:hypothetical protein
MDWRRPIDQQKPVAPPAAPPAAERVQDDFAHSAEYRATGGDPRMLELAMRARAYTERLRRDIRH